mgnify:CR=1 FL=1
MKHLLITRPEHDTATFYISKWSEEIIKEAETKGFKVFDLDKDKARRKNVESYLKSKEIPLLIFNGHGDENSIFGHNDEIIIAKGQNEEILKGKIVYTIACHAAKSLGKECIKKGTKCFIGYKEKFMFYYDANKSASPLKDRWAKPFFVSTNKIPISLIKGNTTKVSKKKAIEEFKRWIIRLRKFKDLEVPFVLKTLLWDMTFLTLLGDENAKV